MDFSTLFAQAATAVSGHEGTIVAALIGAGSSVGIGVGYLVKRLLDQQERTLQAHEQAINRLVDSSGQKDQLLSAQTASIEKLGEAVETSTEETRQLRASFDRFTDTWISKQRGKAAGT